MTETNINALCSVEAVFDGVDIEVTVEFSAGGGTFEHDELTAESRAKENQHPISAITGLQLALDGKSNVGHVHPKESIAGMTILDTPEFADTQITPLADESTYTPTVWTYLVSLFTTVPKSVLQHFVKIWGVVNDLAVRIGLLEDSYLLKYVVPVDTSVIELTTDRYGNTFNFMEGDSLEITFNIPSWVVVSTNLSRINIRINDISASVYFAQNVAPLSYLFTAGTNYKSQRTKINLTLNNNEIIGLTTNQSIASSDGRVAEIYPFYTNGLNATIIFSFIFGSASGSNALIPAGTVFLIKKI